MISAFGGLISEPGEFAMLQEEDRNGFQTAEKFPQAIVERASSCQCSLTSARAVYLLNVAHGQPLNPDYITVWNDFTTNFILAPFFFRRAHPRILKSVPSQEHITGTQVRFYSARCHYIFTNAKVLPYSWKMVHHLT